MGPGPQPSLRKKAARDTSFEEFVQLFRRDYVAGLSARMSYETSIRHLEGYFCGWSLGGIGQQDIERYRMYRLGEEAQGRNRPVSPGTVNREVSCLSAIFRKAVDWGHTAWNPCLGMRKLRHDGRRIRYLEREEYRALHRACEALEDGREWFPDLVALGFHTGMRRGELLELRHDQVRDGWAFLEETKSRRARQVPLNRTAREVLHRRTGSPWVFPALRGNGGPMSYSPVQRRFSRAVEVAGLQVTGPHQVVFHTLRHSWASHLLEAGVSVVKLMAWGGWNRVDEVLRYAHIVESRKSCGIEALEDF